jgi:hypothetical protein
MQSQGGRRYANGNKGWAAHQCWIGLKAHDEAVIFVTLDWLLDPWKQPVLLLNLNNAVVPLSVQVRNVWR